MLEKDDLVRAMNKVIQICIYVNLIQIYEQIYIQKIAKQCFCIPFNRLYEILTKFLCHSQDNNTQSGNHVKCTEINSYANSNELHKNFLYITDIVSSRNHCMENNDFIFVILTLCNKHMIPNNFHINYLTNIRYIILNPSQSP